MINYSQVVLLKTISSNEEKLKNCIILAGHWPAHSKSGKVLFSLGKMVINVVELYQQFVLG